MPCVDIAVRQWWAHKRATGIPVSQDILMEQARKMSRLQVDELRRENPENQLIRTLENFKASTGWVHRFLQRNTDIRTRILSGEGASAPMELIESARPALQSVISSYRIQDVYNCDETSLFFRQGAYKITCYSRGRGS